MEPSDDSCQGVHRTDASAELCDLPLDRVNLYPAPERSDVLSNPKGGIVMSSPLVGAWEPVSDNLQGVWVCTETHYANVAMPKKRQRSERSEPTPEEAMAAYRDVSALAGTYTVSGSRATFKRAANLTANLIGLDLEFEFNVEGDRLTGRIISGSPAYEGRELVWRKVG